MSDQRAEPVYEIDLRELTDEVQDPVVLPDLGEARPSEPRPGRAGDLEHPDPSVRLAALRALTGRPESVPVAAVTARLQDPDPAVRRAAVEVIEGAGDARALVLLLEAIEDPVAELREAAGDALRRRRSPELLALIRKELRVPTRAEAADKALAMLSEGRDGERHVARAPVDPPPEDLPSLLELLADPRPERRRIACERLGSLRARSAVEALLERLADPERGVRIKAADALALIGDERALEGLERARAADPDPGVTMAMRRAALALASER